MRRPMLATVLLAACSTTPPPAVVGPVTERDGPPPAMGTVTLTESGTSQVFTTYDFSIGAFDASAAFQAGDAGLVLWLTAYPGANPKAEAGQLRIKAGLAGLPEGRTVTGDVSIRIEDAGDGASIIRWSNVGRTSWLEVTTITRGTGPDAAYGHVTGSFQTTLCEMTAPEKNDCHEVMGHFDTAVQFDGV